MRKLLFLTCALVASLTSAFAGTTNKSFPATIGGKSYTITYELNTDTKEARVLSYSYNEGGETVTVEHNWNNSLTDFTEIVADFPTEITYNKNTYAVIVKCAHPDGGGTVQGKGTLYYELYLKKKEATVVNGDWDYTDHIMIPDEVQYPEDGGPTYKITTIGKYAFYYCYDLDEVHFGANVSTLKGSAFYRCGTTESGKLRTVKLNLDSDGLKVIEANAINQVVLAANVPETKTLRLGKNITQLGGASATSKDNWYAWGSRYKIERFDVVEGSTSLSVDANGVLYNYDKSTLISFPMYSTLKTYEVPNSVTTIRSYAFHSMQILNTVTGGDNVVRLGSVVSGKSLKSLRMGPKLTDMSTSAFMYCDESFVPVIDNSNTTFKLRDNVLFKYEEDDVILCWYLSGNKATEYVMPSDVTKIGYAAFYPNKYLTSIDYGNASAKLTADKIDKDAYLGTKNSIEFKNADGIYNSEGGVIYNSDHTRLEMFSSNATVVDFVLNEATTTIPRSAVKENQTVKTIRFNSALTTFDAQDYYKWENLESYSVDNDNKKLWADSDGVLYNAAKTKVVSYPRGNKRAYYKVADGTTQIGTYAFYQNKYLMALDLGSSIESVVESNCNNLAKMENLKAIKVETMVPPTVTTSTFSTSQLTNGNIILYVPKEDGAEQIYNNASIWNRFTIVHDVNVFDEEIRDINVDYSVQHLLQNPDDDEYSEKETLPRQGKLLSTTAVTAQTDGIYANYEPQPFEQITLNSSGITIKIKYKSKPFTVTWMNGGSQISTKTYHYGAHFLQHKPDDPTPAAGQHFVGWGATDNATTAINFSGNEVVTANVTYYAIFADNEKKSYQVAHFWENADNDDYTTYLTETYEAPFGTLTNAAAKNYNGFTAQPFEQTTIAEDGSTIVRINYKRNKYIVKWMNGSDEVLSGEYKYGSRLVVPDAPAAPEQTQHFVGWNTDPSASTAMSVSELTVPITDNGVIYYAIFAQNDSKDYTVEHYLQNLDGETYPTTPFATNTGAGTIGEDTKATANTYEGFTAVAFNQQEITNDGATVVIHYTRNRYNVVWMNGETVFSTTPNCLFGSAIEAPTSGPTAAAGEHFVGWNPNSSAESAMDLTDETVAVDGNTYYAIFATNATVHYTVKHYQENLDGTFPSEPTDIDDGTGVIGLKTSASSRSYVGFTAQDFSQIDIAETGTEVRIEYKRKTYSLSWDKNEGDFLTDGTNGENIKFGTPISPATVSRTGYTFFGWSTSTDPNETVTLPETMPDNNLKFYAIWTINQYHAAYYYNNPAHKDEEFTGWNYNFKEKILPPASNPLPSDYDDHHDFVGWSKSENGAIITNENDFGEMSTDGAKFYAIWKIHSHQLAWDVNGGDALTGNYTSGNIDYGTTIEAPNTPTRTGHTFIGWATELDGTPSFNTAETMPDEDLTYYAIWQVNSHTITWNANGGDALTGNYTSGIVDYDSLIVAPQTPTREGHSFLGWAESENGTPTSVAAKMPDHDLTYYAIWEVHVHNMTWYPNGGEFTDADPSGPIAFGEEVTMPQVNRFDENQEWKFAGWAPRADATPEEYVIAKTFNMPDNDLTYYAIWILKKNYVTWKYNYGDDDEFNVLTTHVNVGEQITAPNIVPERLHYQFIGWSAERNGNVITDGNYGVMDDNKKEFFAQWQLNSNLLSWDANGGQLATNGTNGLVEFGTPINRATTENRTGYTFVGWGATADATDTVEITTMPDEELTYYAIWSPNTYNVVWKYNNGSNESFDTTQVVFGENIVAPISNPTRDYHMFMGWSAISNAENATEDLGKLETEGATFYAIWQLRKFTLAWDANGGQLNGDYTQGEVEYGTEIIAPTATMENYIFGGWGTSIKPDLIVNITTMPDSSITFVANWVANQYAVEWRLNDGTENNYISVNVDFGNEITAPTVDPLREHYQFVGWSDEENGDVLTDFGTMDSDHKIFYAQWTINSHTLAWNANGGQLSGDYTTGVVEYGAAVTAPEATLTGHTFNGWGTYAEAPHGVDVSTMPDNDIEYFAIWETNKYRVLWNSVAEQVFKTDTLTFGDTIKVPLATPERQGFSFQGWSADTTGTAIDTFGVITSDTAFYAVWKLQDTAVTPVTFTATWFMNNGTDSVFTTSTFAQGDSIAAPELNPTLGGHQFLGWSDETTGTLISKFGSIKTDTAFYAIWQKNRYVITWNLDQDSIFKADTLAYGDTIIAPSEKPERQHFIFKGWATAESDSVIADFGTTTDSSAFYAVWIEEKQYASVWYYNDGTNSAFETTMVYYGESITAPATNPKRDRYEFKGWASTANGDVKTDFGTMTENGAAFFAVWKAVVYFEAPEVFNSCETGDDFIKLTNISHDNIVFEWNVNGDIDTIQTDGYFEFDKEMALSGTIEVTGVLGESRMTKTIKYQRNKDMLRTMWDDVITVVNGEGHFKSYNWYQNGVLVDTTELHYEEGGLTGTYQLIATTVDDEEITSCEMTFSEPIVATISVYPNPAITTIKVESSSLTPGARISIMDNDGKVRLAKEAIGNGIEELNVSALPQGIYIVKVGNQSVSIIKL